MEQILYFFGSKFYSIKFVPFFAIFRRFPIKLLNYSILILYLNIKILEERRRLIGGGCFGRSSSDRQYSSELPDYNIRYIHLKYLQEYIMVIMCSPHIYVN